MQDDHPLWYDHAEPDEAPGRILLILAGLFTAALAGASRLVRVYGAPDRLWARMVSILARRQRIGAPRS